MKKRVMIISIIYILLLLLLAFIFAPMDKEYVLIREGENIVLEKKLIYTTINDVSSNYKSEDQISIRKTFYDSKSAVTKGYDIESNFSKTTINRTLYATQLIVITLIYLVLIYIFKYEKNSNP